MWTQHAISLSQQLSYYKEYQGKLAKVAGSSKAKSIIKDALYIVGFGSSDFAQNYYANPFLNKVYTPDQYSSYLVEVFSNFITVSLFYSATSTFIFIFISVVRLYMETQG